MDKLFLNKRTYIGTDGEEYINMCIPSLDMTKLIPNARLKLNKDHNGRLDRIVYDVISKDIDNAVDATLYINHIFNPFSVEDGDYIYAPATTNDIYESRSEPELPDGTRLSDSSVKSEGRSYADTVAYLAKKGLGIS